MNKKTLIVNLLGGPGTGKSTTAAAVFAALKQSGRNAELVTEYAKDRVWDEHFHALGNQIYVFGKQYHRLYRLQNKVEVIVTDAPLLLSLYYGDKNTPDSFKQLVIDTHRSMDTLDIFLNRKKKYNPSGRMQTEEEAREIDDKIVSILRANNIPFMAIDADGIATHKIAYLVEERLNGLKS